MVPMPRILRHPEIVDLLRDVGRGAGEVEPAFERLCAIARQYLWVGASQGHAEMVGIQMAASLVLPEDRWDPTDADRVKWDRLREDPPDPDAVARAVHILVGLVGLGGGLRRDREVKAGWDRMYYEKFKDRFPPPQFPYRDGFVANDL